MQHSPQKHPSNKPLIKEKPTSSDHLSATLRGESQLKQNGRDADNPFHILSDEDKVMEDATDEEMTKDDSTSEATEVATNFTSERNHGYD
jgi:hypothetical protein